MIYVRFIISYREGEINQSLSLIYCLVKIDGQIVRHINPYFRRQQHVKPKLFRYNTVMSCCQNCHSYQNSDDDVVVHIHCQG